LFYEEEWLSMKALKPIKAGEEIFNDYGPLPRSDLLRRYGYITDNYAHYDVVEIPIELFTNHTKHIAFENDMYLDEHDIYHETYDISASNPFNLLESLAPELIVLIETLALSEEEFKNFKRRGKLPKPGKISKGGAEILLPMIRMRAKQYATTLDEDTAADADVSMGGNETLKENRYAMAKAIRIGEKRILKDVERALEELVGVPRNSTNKRQAEEADAIQGKRQRA
jgi:SET domain-containing protein 6